MERINNKLILELELNDNNFKFLSSIKEAQNLANKEVSKINKLILDNEENIKKLKPECDKVDYILAVCSGAICEIIDAIHRPIIPTTTDGIKRRVRPGMGRCQGGFCLDKVIKIISQQTGIPFDDIEKDSIGSKWIVDEVKGGYEK